MKEAIRKNNLRVLERMKNPADDLRVIDNAATWYPPRPIIKKLRSPSDLQIDHQGIISNISIVALEISEVTEQEMAVHLLTEGD